MKKAKKPSLPPGEKKVPINFRVHPQKKKDYQEKADVLFGGNLTKYILYQLDSSSQNQITLPSNQEKIDRADFYALVRDLNKLGNNLNQLTRKANMGHFINQQLEETLQDLIHKKEALFALLVERLSENTPKKN